MARLIISAPDGKRGILELTKPVITVGRGNANDLVLNDPSVSRFHAVVKQSPEGAVLIADRGSTNGVMVNGARITAEVELHKGDRARIGAYELVFESVDDSALAIRRADIPSAIENVLRGGPASQPVKISETGATRESRAALDKLERENFLLRMLYDAGKALHAKLSIDDIAAEVMSLAFRVEGVERGFIMLFDEKGEVTRQTEVRYRVAPAKEQPQIILSRSVLERMKTELQPILITDLTADERFRASESMMISGLRSAICAPLVARDRLAGVLYVDNLKRTAAFTQDELDVLTVVAAQAAAAIDSAKTHAELAEHAMQRSALERFLSPEVVEMIAAHPHEVKLGGVSQKVTILFADIRNFTSLSETLPPEKIVEILNEYFTRVTDVIFDYGGTLDKYLGDGVMAVFGAPLSKGNDAASAVRSAIAIQRLVNEMNRDASARDWPCLGVGIGVNTGMVTAGNIGSPRRIDYTVIGDPVNVASRLMTNARAGQTLISEDTARDLGPAPEFQLTRLAPLQVKGKSQPLSVFSVDSGQETGEMPASAV
ncbi:MAG TPA: adenylate/guanylate cyclase domain-containing protein [Terriglobales bacterium]|jgi:adenylate cyclase|nr:adenylate/guanylate cyclase domain-containing protein [Terriglobales bacterium]